jgi:hypothetical protein
MSQPPEKPPTSPEFYLSKVIEAVGNVQAACLKSKAISESVRQCFPPLLDTVVALGIICGASAGDIKFVPLPESLLDPASTAMPSDDAPTPLSEEDFLSDESDFSEAAYGTPREGTSPGHGADGVLSAGTKRQRRRTKPWTPEEDERLRQLVQLRGPHSWPAIAAELGSSRSSDAVSQHWQRVLAPDIRKGKWSDVEDTALFVAIHEHSDHNWSGVSAFMKDQGHLRTGIQCRSRFQNMQRRKPPHVIAGLMRKALTDFEEYNAAQEATPAVVPQEASQVAAAPSASPVALKQETPSPIASAAPLAAQP